jgi:hypothetical protein
MQARMGQPAKRGRLVQLYLNGAYHGLYHIHEHPDEDYMASYFPGPGEDYHFTGGGTTGSDHGGGDIWSTTWSTLKASVNNYAEAARWIDLPNLADYMILSFYAGNDWDWSSLHNWSAAGPKFPDRGGWKFFEQDSDICLQDVNADCTDQAVPDGIFGSLISRHADFKVLFADRVFRHCFHDGVLTPSKVAAAYNARAGEISVALVAETARWQPSSSVGPLPWDRDGEWTVEWDYLKNTFFPQRTTILLNQLRARGWYPVDAPAYNQRGGAVAPGFEVTMTAPFGATVYYTLDGSDPRLPGGAVSPSALTFATALGEAPILPAGSVWKFLDDGSDQGTAWRAPGFADGGWASGPAQLGYGDGDEATVVGSIDTDPVAAGIQRNITTYFRRTFTVADPSAFSGLLVRLKCDDGAAVYLNGQELCRTNLPAGSITVLTPASAAADDGQSFVDFHLAAGAFSLNPAPQSNVLAVEVHQAAASSTDISFDLALLGTFVHEPTPLAITGPTLVRARARVGADWSAINEASFVMPGTVPASAANLIVSEIHYHPAGESDAEFLELLNTSAGPVDAGGVRIGGGVEFEFPPGSVLGPGERLVAAKNPGLIASRFGDTGSPYFHAGVRVAGPWSGSLANGGEMVGVTDAGGAGICAMAYGDDGEWPGRADGSGSSIELIDPAAAQAASSRDEYLSVGSHWRPSAEFHGSPGWAGTGPDNRVVVNEVLTASIAPETDAIELLNTTGGPISIGGWFLSDSSQPLQKYRFPGAVTLESGAFLVVREAEFNNPANPACLVPFGLDSADGDDVFLVEADAAGNPLRFVDRAEFGPAPGGLTIGRFPDGSGPLAVLKSPTLGGPNAARFGDFAAWVASNFPAGSPSAATAPEADPEGDGLINMAEFALGLGPMRVDASPLQVVDGVADGFTFQFPVRPQAGVDVGVAVSNDLVTWDGSGAEVEIVGRQPGPDGTEVVTARLRPSPAVHRNVRIAVRW